MHIYIYIYIHACFVYLSFCWKHNIYKNIYILYCICLLKTCSAFVIWNTFVCYLFLFVFVCPGTPMPMSHVAHARSQSVRSGSRSWGMQLTRGSGHGRASTIQRLHKRSEWAIQYTHIYMFCSWKYLLEAQANPYPIHSNEFKNHIYTYFIPGSTFWKHKPTLCPYIVTNWVNTYMHVLFLEVPSGSSSQPRPHA